jgi:predicted transcriptional regulator
MNDAGFEFRRVLHVSGWSQSEVSLELGVSTAAVNQWTKRGMPAGRVLDIQKLTQQPIEQIEGCVYQPPAKRPTPRYDRGFLSYQNAGEMVDVIKRLLDEYTLQEEDAKLIASMLRRLGRKKVG